MGPGLEPRSQLLLLWAVLRCQSWKGCLGTSKCPPYPHFTDGDTEAQGGIGPGPRSFSPPNLLLLGLKIPFCSYSKIMSLERPLGNMCVQVRTRDR